MKTLSKCPPLTPDDILTLRGNPVSKRIEAKRNSSATKIEEWIYYNESAKIKESYSFKDGRLISYKTNGIFV